MSPKIKPRERDAIVQSLRSGVVPRIGLQHIQVGRAAEVKAMLADLERIKDGAASVRFVVGRFGSGKSFFLNLVRAVAFEKRFVVVQADITTERRLQGSSGHARALYNELMRNMATRAKPEGGALEAVVAGFVANIEHELNKDEMDLQIAISSRLEPLMEMVHCYDFIKAIQSYADGYATQNEDKKQAALRWLRAEYSTKTDAKRDLGTSTIIDDDNIYDYLKVLARFVSQAVYAGLVVNIDELVVLSTRLNHVQARTANYEMILRIVNDCLQGNASNIGFLFAGTDSCLEDRRRGLFSYEALQTRLGGPTQIAGYTDYSHPVLRLQSLTPEELFVLLLNIRRVFASGDDNKNLVDDDQIRAFMIDCAKRLGAEYFTTPRDVVKRFTSVLSILEQNPGAKFAELVESVPLEHSEEASLVSSEESPDGDDDLANFKL
ncbi:ATP-binding protein [bacterium]|nr:ATP-binding protein [bacterium]